MDFPFTKEFFILFHYVMNSGVYCLIIELLQRRILKIGCLGTYIFSAGYYVYVGSAQKNLEQRIERHLRKKKKLRWHIDYLLRYGQVIDINTYSGEKSVECTLNNQIGNIRNTTIPVKGFGSSDCSCLSHLHFFRNNPGKQIVKLNF